MSLSIYNDNNISQELSYPKLADFGSICRICFNKLNLQSIYSFNNNIKMAEKQDISGLMNLYCGVMPCKGDNLPNMVCQKCSDVLLKAWELRVTCKKSDIILKAILQDNLNKSLELKHNVDGIQNILTSQNEQDIIKNVCKTEINVSNFMDTDDFTVSENSNSENNLSMSQNINIMGNDIDQIVDNLLKELSLIPRTSYNKNTCPICDKEVPEQNLRKHLVLCHHTMTKIGYKCYKCEKILDTMSDRELHEDLYCAEMIEGTLYKCSACSTTATNREEFDKHLCINSSEIKQKGKKTRKEYMAKIGSKNKECFICEICGLTLKQRHYYLKHILRHENKHWIHCKLCPFKTPNRYSYSIHVKFRHLGHELLKCDKCPYETHRQANLKVHQMRHTGERPYSCNLCSYKGINHSNLKRHMIKHTNVRDYECKTCGLSYTGRKSLKHHIQRVHEHMKMFYCKPCHTKYVGEDAFNNHLKKKHTQDNKGVS